MYFYTKKYNSLMNSWLKIKCICMYIHICVSSAVCATPQPTACFETVACSSPNSASIGHIAHPSSRSQCVETLAAASCHVCHARTERTNSLLLARWIVTSTGWVFLVYPKVSELSGGKREDMEEVIWLWWITFRIKVSLGVLCVWKNKQTQKTCHIIIYSKPAYT